MLVSIGVVKKLIIITVIFIIIATVFIIFLGDIRLLNIFSPYSRLKLSLGFYEIRQLLFNKCDWLNNRDIFLSPKPSLKQLKEIHQKVTKSTCVNISLLDQEDFWVLSLPINSNLNLDEITDIGFTIEAIAMF